MSEFRLFDPDISEGDETSIELVSVQRYLTLAIVSFGVYQLWWMYKHWKFFKEKDRLNIMPASRAIISILFLQQLLGKIKKFAEEHNQVPAYSPGLLFGLYILFNLSSMLPEPFWLISFGCIWCTIPAMKTFNATIQESSSFTVTNNENEFNRRQIIVLILGVILWLLFLIGMFTV